MFDLNKFEQSNIKIRTRSVPVPLLKDFFSEGDELLWEVSALTAEDVALINTADKRAMATSALIESIVSGGKSGKAEAIKEMLGVSDSLPEDTARRIETILIGSVNLDYNTGRDTVIKLSIYFPTVFTEISNVIFELSGEGGEVMGKP